MSLFRPEVLESQRRRLWGDVRLSQPPSLTAWSGVLAAVAIAVIVALGLGTYVKKETVGGYLAPAGGIVQLAPSRSGRIVRIFAEEGDHIAIGDPLLELTAEIVGAETGQVFAAQAKQIEQQIADAKMNRDASKSSLDAEGMRLRDQLASQAARRAILEQRIADQTQLVEISESQNLRFQELARDGYVSGIQLNEQRQQLLSRRGELSTIRSERESVLASIADLRAKLADLPAQQRGLDARARVDVSELEQKRIDTLASQKFVERAPVSGTISTLQAEVGQLPSAQVPLISIMPDDSELRAELLVPTRAAGFIKIGDEVRLQIDAYPFERFGFVMGTVKSVSRSAIRPGELLAPIDFKEAVYRVRVSLAHDYVMTYGRQTLLRPGLSLEADIIIDRKSLWRHLIDPVLAAARRTQ